MTTNTPAPIPTLDLKAQYRAIRTEIEAAMLRVLESQHFILGPEVVQFEKELAVCAGSSSAVGVASGSDALLLCLMALGIGPGDEVLTTPYTFFATAGAVARLGARPVFVDIDPKTYNLAPEQAEAYLRGAHPILNDRSRFDHDPARVKAILPVHLFGQCADMAPLLALAHRHDVPLVEDTAQAIGAGYQGRPAGTMGRCGCLSFFPSKNLGAAGDAGAIVTDDAALADRLRMLRAHGSRPKYYHPLLGMNSRLDALQAAILRVKLPYLDAWVRGRQAAAARYDDLLGDVGGLTLPWRRPGDRHIFNQYVVRSAQRDRLMAALKAARIGCEIYYPLPMHLQQCFGYLGYRTGDLPESEAAAAETLAIPLYPEIERHQQERVRQALVEGLGGESSPGQQETHPAGLAPGNRAQQSCRHADHSPASA
jgi:dTDP-4-amino-4,6-dideoxygalactose transaminase